jgi:polyribonucleotide nucleotidyltransferase
MSLPFLINRGRKNDEEAFGRREVGHGNPAHAFIKRKMMRFEEYPYTVRVGKRDFGK